MEMNFCRRCGTKLKNIQGHVFECASGHPIFANASPTVGIFFITENDEVVVSVRGIEPHKGKLDSFGGFLNGAETLEAATERELEEELGIRPGDYDPPAYFTSGIGRYDYKDETLPVISSFFWTRLKPGVQLKPADDVAAVKTLLLQEVDLVEMHDDDTRNAIQELQKLFTKGEPA